MTLTHQEETQASFDLTAAHHDFSRGLNAHAFFKIHDHTIGEDLVQDTFMKVWSYLVKGGKVDVMRAFLYHILNNLIIDQYRKHKSTSLDTLLEKGFEPAAENPGRFLDVFDGKAAVLLIKRLPIKYQKVMRMRYVQGLSLKEIAVATGQSKNTVAVQCHRGLAKVKRLYEPATK
jgi:RNA polymerase sigma-70 factor (ECF subfamily)